MFLIVLLVISLISLGFDSTRLFGVVVLTLISYVYPLLLLALIALGGFFFYFTQGTQK